MSAQALNQQPAERNSPQDLGADIATVLVEKSANGTKWQSVDVDEGAVQAIQNNDEVDPVIARILVARGVCPEAAKAYLQPSLKTEMPDPYVLTDMEKAAHRLAKAITDHQTVGIFGDYDVDGVTASSLLYLYLQSLERDVEVYLPDRVSDGYGPSIAAFEDLQRRGAQLIVTVDCGASAHDPIEQAGAKGLEIVVMDHHLMSGPPPASAHAVVNPNRKDDLSGLVNLSAAGVTFMLLVAVNRVLRQQGFFKDRQEPDLRQWLDLTALGLVCDVMTVKGLTRTLIAQGLKVLTRQLATGAGGNSGLASLAHRAGVKGQASPYHLGFLIGPRINAAGRVGHANMAFDLITTHDAAKRNRLTEQLHMMNAERQALEADVLQDAMAQVERADALSDILVVAGEGWHQGVIGIVAGRLKEKYNRPAIVIALDGDIGKGSGRSLTGVDLGGAIAAAREAGLLIAGGGHAMAAGLTIATDQIDAFKSFLQAQLTGDVAYALANRKLDIDGVIAPQAVTAHFAGLIAQAGPFGAGNAEPVFMMENMHAVYPKCVGDAHIACTLRSEGGYEVRAIAFRAAEEPLGDILKSGEKMHVAGRIKADDWRGGNAGQFQIMDAVACP